MREFLSNKPDPLTALRPEDCRSFAAKMLADFEKDATSKDPNLSIQLTSKVWPEHWTEAAEESRGEPFRVWFTAHEYMIFESISGSTVTVEDSIFRASWTMLSPNSKGGKDIWGRPPARLEVIAAEVTKAIKKRMKKAEGLGYRTVAFCSSCDGSGIRDGLDDDFPSGLRQCEDCGGTGKVQKEVAPIRGLLWKL
jgi:hypothetical protein